MDKIKMVLGNGIEIHIPVPTQPANADEVDMYDAAMKYIPIEFKELYVRYNLDSIKLIRGRS